jgi:hypothetical protein
MLESFFLQSVRHAGHKPDNLPRDGQGPRGWVGMMILGDIQWLQRIWDKLWGAAEGEIKP